MLGKRKGKQRREYVPDYVLYDLETTGISSLYDEVIEISAVKVRNGKIVDEFSELVNPGRPIPYAASSVNNISDKMVENTIGEFSTTTLSGEEFTKNDLSPVTFFAFMDASDKDAQSFYDELKKAYEGVKEKGGDIVVCNKNTDEVTLFEGAPFPVIEYNDSLKKATEKYTEMIEEIKNTGVWCLDGSFPSSWTMKINAENLIEEAEKNKEFLQEQDSSQDGGIENNMAEVATMG